MRALLQLGFFLVVYDYRIRFRKAVFGLVWYLLPFFGFASLAIWAVGAGDVNSAHQSDRQILEIIVGLTIWQTFSASWLEPVRLAKRFSTLIKFVVFDRMAILVAGGLSAFFALIVRLPFTVALLFWFDVTYRIEAVLLPVLVIGVFAAGLAAACLTVPLTLGLRDVRYGLNVSQLGLLFATPIFYSSPSAGSLSTINSLNPMSYLILPIREVMLGRHQTINAVVLPLIISIIVLAIASVYYKSKIPLISSYIGR